jgi:hypothetical protein
MAGNGTLAFHVGNAERLSLDAGGVALAAIQGLNQVARNKEARIARFEAELAELRQAGP